MMYKCKTFLLSSLECTFIPHKAPQHDFVVAHHRSLFCHLFDAPLSTHLCDLTIDDLHRDHLAGFAQPADFLAAKLHHVEWSSEI